MKFVVDGMLGKLARWLRLMGYDVEYSNAVDDSQLLAMAESQHRSLLTRDFDLYRHAIARDISAFYIEGRTKEEQLAALAGRFGIRLKIEMDISRCPKCNTTVKQIPKEKTRERVEGSTFRYYSEFWECPKCHQVYWQGAHWTRIRKTLNAAESQLEIKRKKVV